MRPAVWLLVALLAGVGIGAAVTARRSAAVERVRAEADRSALAVLGLQAGSPSLARGAGLPDSQGRSTVMLDVPLTNRGPDPVQVRVQGLDVAGRATSGRPSSPVDAADRPAVAVAPGATATTSVPVLVRCDEVLPPALDGVSRGASGSRLRVGADVPGGPRRAALPLSEGGGTVGDVISSACAPPQQRRAPVSVTWTPRDDGSLEVAVIGSTLARGLALGLQQTPGLGVSSDLVLSATISTVTPTVADLTMRPTCSRAALPGKVPVASFEVVTLGQDRQVRASVPDDDGVKAAWTARQPALRCG